MFDEGKTSSLWVYSLGYGVFYIYGQVENAKKKPQLSSLKWLIM